MATKHIYLGSDKFCYTEACDLHLNEHLYNEAYTSAYLKGSVKTLAVIEGMALSAGVSADSMLSIKVNAFAEKFGRKPKIGLDLDGTTGNFNQGMKSFVMSQDELPENVEVFNQEPETYAMWEGQNPWFKDKADFTAKFTQAEAEGLYRKLEAYEDAAVTIRELRNIGFDIDAVTARFKKFNNDTAFWLRQHDIPVYRIKNPGTEKASVPNIDVYIDDAPHVIEKLVTNAKNVVIMNQPYNTQVEYAHEFTRRVDTWGHVMKTAVVDLLPV